MIVKVNIISMVGETDTVTGDQLESQFVEVVLEDGTQIYIDEPQLLKASLLVEEGAL